MNIYRSFEQWKNGGFLEHGAPRTEEYTEEELHLVEMGWNYGYDAGRTVEQALDKKADNARELGLSYDDEPKIGCVNHDCAKCKAQSAPVQEPFGYLEIDDIESQREYPNNCRNVNLWYEGGEGMVAIYTAPPIVATPLAAHPAVPLTWVSVKDRLPPVGEDVLTYDVANTIDGFDCERRLGLDEWSVKYSVSHWMPIPAAPEKGQP